MRYGIIIDTPVGMIGLEEENGSLVSVNLAGALSKTAQKKTTPLLLEAQRQLGEYFCLKRTEFCLPLAPSGTQFQKKVWKELQKIPYGSIETYSSLALKIGSPKAYRAVGLACGRNPLAIFIPCHRVIGKNGGLTGFAGGLPMKKFLLELEKGQG